MLFPWVYWDIPYTTAVRSVPLHVLAALLVRLAFEGFHVLEFLCHPHMEFLYSFALLLERPRFKNGGRIWLKNRRNVKSVLIVVDIVKFRRFERRNLDQIVRGECEGRRGVI